MSLAPPSAASDGAHQREVDRRSAGDRQRTATTGESAAAAHLERLGFQILARNLRLGRDEIDVLAIDPDGRTVVIVEVKCRSHAHARPEDRIDGRKRQRLARAALQLSMRPQFAGAPLRFDAISVVHADSQVLIEHWPGAFEAR